MSRMAKVTEMFERVAFKITSFKYIMVIKSAFVTLMPVIIAGAFARKTSALTDIRLMSNLVI
ncbi:hypothetical protein DT075_03025 [Bacillus licheniformis]|nr:hypothetical protein DT075_03025 [Bacillus licheniformis]